MSILCITLTHFEPGRWVIDGERGRPTKKKTRPVEKAALTTSTLLEREKSTIDNPKIGEDEKNTLLKNEL